MNQSDVGSQVARSPVGKGTLTGFSDAGYPQVSGIAVAWLVLESGEKFGIQPNEANEKELYPDGRLKE